MSPSNDRTVLLFCHGASYNKECWNPIIDRVLASPLYKNAGFTIEAFDWHYHGEKSDYSTKPTVFFEDGRETSPRVEHPLKHWTKWAPEDLVDEVAMIRKDDEFLGRRTRVIGIGHSMGASSILKVETMYPGTFDGIIAFELIYDAGVVAHEMKESLRDMLISITLAREGEWDTWEEVLEHIKTSRAFRRWHPEVVESFLEHGVEKVPETGKYRLVISPEFEAAVYCQELMQFPLEAFAKTKCPVVLEHAEHSPFFVPSAAKLIADQLPGRVHVSRAIKNTTHGVVVEDPDTCATRIITGLQKFPIIQARIHPPFIRSAL